jgi:hypothetical protein
MHAGWACRLPLNLPTHSRSLSLTLQAGAKQAQIPQPNLLHTVADDALLVRQLMEQISRPSKPQTVQVYNKDSN